MNLYNDASLVITPNAFKAGKLYAVKGADLDVTRATSATRVNANGVIETMGANVPRIDYTGGGCPSILVEPQRTNLFTYSEQFDNISWIKLSSNVTSNATTAPDGTTTADKLIEDNTNANHLVQQVVVASNASYTFSVFAKKAERNWVVLRSVNASFQNVKAWFNIDAGTIGTLENGATAKITNFSNGWYKLEMTIPSYSTGFEFRISTSTGNGIDSYTGTSGSGLYLWGAQLEAGSYATSYILTTSASVTRNADVISKTGISDLIGQTEGTIFLDIFASAQNSDSVPGFSVLCDIGTGANRIQIYTNNGFIGFIIYNPGALVIASAFSITPNTNIKVALGYSSGATFMFVNGAQVATTAAVLSLSGLDAFTLNKVFDADLSAKNNYNSAVLFKTRLTNAKLAELTTL